MGIKGVFTFVTDASHTAERLNELVTQLVGEFPDEFGHPIWVQSMRIDGQEAAGIFICKMYL